LKQTDEDVWSLKEKYFLAAAVARSGNGVSLKKKVLIQQIIKISNQNYCDRFNKGFNFSIGRFDF